MGRRGRRRGAEGRDHTLPTLRSHGQVGIPRFPHPEPSVARSSHSGRDRCSLRQLRQWRKVRRRRSSGRCPRSYCETPSDCCRRSARRFSGTSSRRWRRSRIGGFSGGRKEAGERAQFRLLFLLVEAIRRKPVKRELEGAIHLAGFALLMGLMVLLTYKDIIRFFVKG
mgnify:CR=1 FL=1